jgi:hypothetical protein
VELLGVNQPAADLEEYNRLTTATNLLPWLQDTAQANVAALWNAAYRDVMILDSSNRVTGVMNLSTYDLTLPANRDRLKEMLRTTANAGDSDGDKLPDHWEYRSFAGLNATGGEDADGDGFNNFLELAFGTNPNSRAEVPIVNLGFNSANRFQVSFDRWAGGASDYLVEMSTNLVDWTSSAVHLLSITTNYCDGTGRSRTTYNLRRSPAQLPTGVVRINARPKE